MISYNGRNAEPIIAIRARRIPTTTKIIGTFDFWLSCTDLESGCETVGDETAAVGDSRTTPPDNWMT